MTSAPVLREVLQLSAVSCGRHAEIPRKLAESVLARRDFHLLLEGTGTQALQVSTAFALEKVEQFMEAVPDSWVPTYSWDGGNPTWVLVGFDHPSHPRITLAVAALMSRLGA